ncbi:MAG: putative aminohydrolase SsnA [Tissierellia bacterium]|nr:putative aminohydrolase SsnA [Tissierellia bacterium]
MIIGNGRLYTNDPDNLYIENGAVYIEGGLVKEVGKFEDIKAKYPNEELLDADGRLIMPGMINAHTHIYSSYARGMSVDKPQRDFNEILENLWWNLDKKLTLKDTELNAYTTYMESIRNGTTTVIDHHASPYHTEGSLFKIAEVAKKIGIRTSLCYEVSDRDGEEITDQQIKENVDFIKAYQGDDQSMIKGLFGLHASFTVSDKTLEKSVKAMQGLDSGYHVHVAEGIKDQMHCVQTYGRRIVERFYDWGLLGKKSLAVHCVHTNIRELEILRDTDTNCVHNPESNMGNAVGCTPAIKMIEMGLRLGLGTDAYTHDMFESMKVANILHRHHLCNPTVGFMETMTMQFVNNPIIAQNVLDSPQLGIIKEGAAADIITMEYNPITPFSGDNFYGHALFGMTGRLTNDVVINGKLILKDRKFVEIDEEEIVAKSREGAAAIWPKM